MNFKLINSSNCFQPISKVCFRYQNPFCWSQFILKRNDFKFTDDVDVMNSNNIQVHSCNMTVFSSECNFEILK